MIPDVGNGGLLLPRRCAQPSCMNGLPLGSGQVQGIYIEKRSAQLKASAGDLYRKKIPPSWASMRLMLLLQHVHVHRTHIRAEGHLQLTLIQARRMPVCGHVYGHVYRHVQDMHMQLFR